MFTSVDFVENARRLTSERLKSGSNYHSAEGSDVFPQCLKRIQNNKDWNSHYTTF